jgi:NADPH2:quinone reductase
MVSFGNASGAVPPISLLALANKGSLYVTRPVLGHHLAMRDVGESMARELFDMVASGRVKIEIAQRYTLEDAAQAHRDLEARATTGSSILIP